MLSRYFSRAEFEKSQTATRNRIGNRMTATALANARLTCQHVADPLRVLVGPITVNSGYRGPALNRAVGGSATSDHCHGRAMDIETALLYGQGGLSTRELFDAVRLLQLPFDQLILEYPGSNPRDGWVHVGYRHGGGRRQVLFKSHGPYRSHTAAPVHTENLRAVVAAFQVRVGMKGRDVDGLVGPVVRKAVAEVAARVPVPR